MVGTHEAATYSSVPIAVSRSGHTRKQINAFDAVIPYARKSASQAVFSHLCCTSHKKRMFRQFFEQIHNWKHLFLCIFLVRHSVISAITPVTPLIRKCTTRRWTLRCFHHSVAKRQQFSYPLRTATLSQFSNCGSRGVD